MTATLSEHEQSAPRISREQFAVIAAVTIGGVHLLEHVVQVLQRYAFGLPGGNGLAGSIADIEPVHFVYNTAYLALVIVVTKFLEPALIQAGRMTQVLIVATIAIQTWHVFEHTVKIVQYVALGERNGVGGVFGIGPAAWMPLFPIPLLHFAYNLVVYLPFLAALVLLTHSRRRKSASIL